jgi:hypothetical protein
MVDSSPRSQFTVMVPFSLMLLTSPASPILARRSGSSVESSVTRTPTLPPNASLTSRTREPRMSTLPTLGPLSDWTTPRSDAGRGVLQSKPFLWFSFARLGTSSVSLTHAGHRPRRNPSRPTSTGHRPDPVDGRIPLDTAYSSATPFGTQKAQASSTSSCISSSSIASRRTWAQW